MVDYRWQCLVCETGNDPEADYCLACGCPIDADNWVVDGWTRSLTNPPQKPSNIGYMSRWDFLAYKFTRTSPCPYCGLHMYIYDGFCPHCGIELTLFQRHRLIGWMADQQSAGRRFGIWMVPVFILLAATVFYVATNF